MVLVNDSLKVVLNGDWNKLYIQPEWIAQNVFEKEEVEIWVNGKGADFSISYRNDSIIIFPRQSKMVFSIVRMYDAAIADLCRCVNQFISKAYTPELSAYGLNVDFAEENGTMFAEVLDSMSDTSAIIESGYEVVSTTVSRTLKCDDIMINMESILENGGLKIHFNEQHVPDETGVEFDLKNIKDFLDKCCVLLQGLGYEIESEDEL